MWKRLYRGFSAMKNMPKVLANRDDRPHTLPATQLYLSHLAPSLSQQSQSLKEKQNMVSADNVATLERVQQQRREIEALVRGLETVVSDLDTAVGSLTMTEELRDEMRNVDLDMRTTA